MKIAFLFPIHNEEKRIQLTLKFIKFAAKSFISEPNWPLEPVTSIFMFLEFKR